MPLVRHSVTRRDYLRCQFLSAPSESLHAAQQSSVSATLMHFYLHTFEKILESVSDARHDPNLIHADANCATRVDSYGRLPRVADVPERSVKRSLLREQVR